VTPGTIEDEMKRKEPLPAQPRTILAGGQFADKVGDIARHRDLTIREVLDKYAGAAIDREHRKCCEEQLAEYGGES
jgi:hypothetical protein